MVWLTDKEREANTAADSEARRQGFANDYDRWRTTNDAAIQDTARCGWARLSSEEQEAIKTAIERGWL